MQTVHHPKAGDYTMPAWPVRFSGRPPTVKPAPLLGQHTDDVLAHWLELDNDHIGSLRQQRIVGS